MPATNVRGRQINDGDVGREDLNITTASRAVITKVIAGTGITLSSTGAATGTGDVTINSSMPALTGDVTTTAGSTVTSISSTVITGKPLTNFFVGLDQEISAGDTILSAFGKLQGQLNARPDSYVTGVSVDYNDPNATTLILERNNGLGNLSVGLIAGTPTSGDLPFFNGSNLAWNSGIRTDGINLYYSGKIIATVPDLNDYAKVGDSYTKTEADARYPVLDGSGKIQATNLPSYVDDVIEGATTASFPTTGESGKIYVALDSNKSYRWSGSTYVEIVASPGSVDWGIITNKPATFAPSAHTHLWADITDKPSLFANLGAVADVDAMKFTGWFRTNASGTGNPFGASGASGFGSFESSNYGWQLLGNDGQNRFKVRNLSAGAWGGWIDLYNAITPLAGYTIGAAADITSSDTILSALGKLEAKVNAGGGVADTLQTVTTNGSIVTNANWILRNSANANFFRLQNTDGSSTYFNAYTDANSNFVATIFGNVGIGLGSPTEKLEVSGYIKSGHVAIGSTPGTSAPSPKQFITLGGDVNAGLLLGSNLYVDNGSLYIAKAHATISGAGIFIPGNQQPNQNAIIFHTQPAGSVTADTAYSSQRMIITPDGNVGINAPAPGERLEVAGGILSKVSGDAFPHFFLERVGGTTYTNRKYDFGISSAGGLGIDDVTAGVTRIRIDTNGNVGIGTSTFNWATTNRTVLAIEGGGNGSMLEMHYNAAARAYLYRDANQLQMYDASKLSFLISGQEVLNIPASGVATFNVGASSNVVLDGRSTWGGGSTKYPALRSTSADEYIMLHLPHIPYLQNGVGGYTGAVPGARVRFAGNTTASTYWDTGVWATTDRYSIGRSGTELLWINITGELNTRGSSCGYNFADRGNNANTWSWYASGGVTNLWESTTQKNVLQITTSGMTFQNNTVYHSGNLNPNQYRWFDGWIASPGYDANTIAPSKSGFTYGNNAPWAGCLVHFETGGGTGGYGLQLNSNYSGAQKLSFRTRNGDANAWNSWYEVYHSANLPDSDFRFNTVKVVSGNGKGYGFWNSPPETYGIFMGDTATYGAPFTDNSSGLSNDYHIYFRINGNNRGYIFTDGTGVQRVQITTQGLIVSNQWIRTTGANGWYNQTYGGGIHMSDSTWVRIYGGKSFSVTANMQVEGTSTFGPSASAIAISSNKINFNNAGSTANSYMAENWGIAIHGTATQIISIPDSVIAVGLTPTGGNYGVGHGYFTGDVIAYYSDGRLKENIQPIENALEKLLKVRGVTYTANDLAIELGAAEDKHLQVGVISQDFESVLPQVLKRAPFDMDGRDKSKSGQDYMTVKYERIVPLLIEAQKEQYGIVQTYKSETDLRIEQLEKRVKELEALIG